MSEVLVLVDHLDGKVRKPTYELLTIAKRLGEPSAVFIGGGDKADGVVDAVKKYGAEKVYVVDDAEIKGYLVAPKAEALQQLAEKTDPAAILIPSNAEGKEIAARLAIKLGSGLITDAVAPGRHRRRHSGSAAPRGNRASRPRGRRSGGRRRSRAGCPARTPWSTPAPAGP